MKRSAIMKRSLLSFFILFYQFVLGSNFYAGADGNWNNVAIWVDGGGMPIGSLPTSSDDVIIDGYEVTVPAIGLSPNVCNNLIIRANSRNDNAYLRISSGATLSVRGDVTVTTPNNRDRNIGIAVQGRLNVSGSVTYTRPLNYTRNRVMALAIDGGVVRIEGDLNYYYYSASNSESYDDIYMINASTLSCRNVNFRKDAGGQININMENSATWNVSGDFTIDENGGDDFEFVMSGSSSIDIRGNFTATNDGSEDIQWEMTNNAGTNHFHVGGDFLIDHNSGEDIDIELSNMAQIVVDGDYTIDWDGARANDSDIDIRMTGSSKIDIDGSLEMDMNETVRGSCDIRLDMDNTSIIEVGLDNGLMTENAGITLSDGDRFDFQLDRDAQFIVYGEARFLQAGDGYFYIYLNQHANGSANDAQMRVDGRFRINKTDGDAFRLYAQNDADINCGDDLQISITGFDGGYQHAEIQLENDAVIDVDGSFSYTMNVSNNNYLMLDMDQNAAIYVGVDDGNLAESTTISMLDGYRVDVQMDRDTKFYTYGNMTVNQSGNEHLYFYLNQSANGSSTDAQVRVDGDLTFTKNDGDAFRIYAQNDADIDVGGNFSATVTNFDGNGQHAEIQLEDQVVFDVDGSFSFTMNTPNNNYLIIDMDQDAAIYVGVDDGNLAESATLSVIDGYRLDFDLDRNAKFYTYGNMSFSHAGNEHMHISLNQNANGTGTDGQLRVDGNLDITKTDGDQFRIDMRHDADMDIGGNLNIDIGTFDGNGSNAIIYMVNDTKIDVDGNFDFTLNDTHQNNLFVDMDNNAIIEVGVDDGNLAKHATLSILNGYGFQFDMDRDSKFIVYGNTTMNQSGNQEFNIRLNYNADGSVDDAQLQVDGNLTISKDDGDRFFLRQLHNSDLDIGGDFTLDITGHDAGWQNDEIELNDQSAIDVDGNFRFILDVANQNYAIIDMDDDASFTIGVSPVILTKKADFKIEGYGLDFDLDRNAEFTVYGDMDISDSGDEYLDIALNGNDNGSGSDAQLNIYGSLTIDKTDGDRFRFRQYYDSDAIINGDFTYHSTNHDGGSWDNEYIIVEDNAKLDIGKNFVYSMNDPSNHNDFWIDLDNNGFIDITGNAEMTMIQGESFYIDMDRDSRMDIGGNFSCNSSCNGTMDIEFNANNNGTGTDAQLTIGGDWTIVKSNGDQFSFAANYDTDIKVGGDFSYTSTNHDGGMWDDEIFRLNNNSTLDVDGNFTVNMDDPTRQNDLYFDLNDNSVLSMGTNLTNSSKIYMEDGYRMRIRLDNSAQLNAYGDLEVGFNGNDTWAECDISLNRDNGTDAEMHVTGSLELSNDYNQDLFQVRLDESSVLDVDGNIDIRSAIAQDRIEIETRDNTELHIGGSFLRNATPNHYGILDCQDNSTVYYDGDGSFGQQVVAENYGDGTDGFSYQYVVINNTWGTVPQLTMEGTTEIIAGRDLKFTDGIVEATSTKYFKILDNATVSDASDDSYVQGYIHKIGDDAFTFPVGNTDNDDGNTRYAPATLTPYALGIVPSTSTEFAVSYTNINPNAVGDTSLKESPIHHVSREEYWLIDDVVRNSSWNVKLSWKFPRSGQIDNMSEIRVAHWNGSLWQNYGNDATTGTTTDGTITVNNISNFSPFTLASVTAQNPLPVELISFTGEFNNSQVDLTWQTVSEINNDYFDIQRSQDGINFETIGKIKGAGNSNITIDYNYTDFNPYSGISYYRLKQVDFDGRYEYSNIVKVNYKTNTTNDNNKPELSVFPNPAINGDNVRISISGMEANKEILVVVNNIIGEQLYSKIILTDANGEILETIAPYNQLSQGTYVIVVASDDNIVSKKLIITR